MWVTVNAGRTVPSSQVLKETMPWGMLSGLCSAMAIYLIIKAMSDVDYVVAFTISQCSVLVTGLWGWLLFGELGSPSAVRAFFISCFALVLGASVVGYYGTAN